MIFLVLVYYHWQFVELKNLHRQPRQPWASRWTKINQPGCLFQCCFVNFLFSFSLSPLPHPFIAVLMVPVGRTSSPWCVHSGIVHQISFVLTVPLLISPKNGALPLMFNSEPLSFPLPFLCQHSSVGFDGKKKENFWLSLIPQNYTEEAGLVLQDTKPLKSLRELFGSYWISLSWGEQKMTFYFGEAQIFKSAVTVKRTPLFEKQGSLF